MASGIRVARRRRALRDGAQPLPMALLLVSCKEVQRRTVRNFRSQWGAGEPSSGYDLSRSDGKEEAHTAKLWSMQMGDIAPVQTCIASSACRVPASRTPASRILASRILASAVAACGPMGYRFHCAGVQGRTSSDQTRPIRLCFRCLPPLRRSGREIGRRCFGAAGSRHGKASASVYWGVLSGFARELPSLR